MTFISFRVLAKIFLFYNVTHLKDNCFLVVKSYSFLFGASTFFFNLTHQKTEIRILRINSHRCID